MDCFRGFLGDEHPQPLDDAVGRNSMMAEIIDDDTSSCILPAWSFCCSWLPLPPHLSKNITKAVSAPRQRPGQRWALEETDQTKSEVQSLVWKAECWEVVGAVAVSLALLSCGIAVWRRENVRWAWMWIVVLLSLYVGLELLMV